MTENSLTPAAGGSTALAETESARAIQEVQAAMVIAKRFPRDQVAATERLINACTRPKLAETALYSYSRGNAEVTGASIRLAETAAQCWGNINFGIRELEQRGGESTVEAYAWDLETNARQVKVFQVPHVRHTRTGSYKLTDPRDIYEHVANQGARRLRACILGVIPGDVIEAAVEQCEETMQASADTSAEGVKKLAEAFSKWGVSEEMISKRIGCRLEAIRPAQVVHLRKIYASIRDGISKPQDWFQMGQPKAGSTTLADIGKPEPAPEPTEPEPKPAEPAPEPEQTALGQFEDVPDKAAGESEAAPEPTELDPAVRAEYLAAIKGASTIEEVLEVGQYYDVQMDETLRKEYKARKVQLELKKLEE